MWWFRRTAGARPASGRSPGAIAPRRLAAARWDSWSCSIAAALRAHGELRSGQLEHTLGSMKAIRLGQLGAEIEPHRNGQVSIVEVRQLDIRHVPPVFPAANPADGQRLPGRLVDAQHEQQAADEMDEQVARHPGAVLLPT